MVVVGCQRLVSPAALPLMPASLSVLVSCGTTTNFVCSVHEPPHLNMNELHRHVVQSYNVLLPNSQDGWWNYKMYHPPLDPSHQECSSWEYRKSLLRERIGLINADVVCIQEVSPVSFEQDFAFMTDELGYDGVELFKKGRFRPATFWKKEKVELATPAQHKDRTLLTTFRLLDDTTTTETGDGVTKDEYWHVLNCHLQAGKQGGRRVRQVLEGVSTAFKTAKNKLKGMVRYVL